MPVSRSLLRVTLAVFALATSSSANAEESSAMSDPTPVTVSDINAAIRARDAKRAVALLDRAPEVIAARDADGRTPLTLAAYMEQSELVALLRDRRGAPDFFEACIVGDEGVVRAALARGQNVDERAPDGYTPLGLAVFFRNPAIARLLIDAGADLDAKASNLQAVAPIHAAVARGDLATLTLLLERGADPNLTQEKHVRPLHDAAITGNSAAAALLLMYGADPAARTEEGQSAADLAHGKGHSALAQRLQVLAARR
jgi:ankyrin repeat protein